MITNIQGGMSMVADFGTIIGFLGLVSVKLLSIMTPLDCLGSSSITN